jgi:hypothetical protein
MFPNPTIMAASREKGTDGIMIRNASAEHLPGLPTGTRSPIQPTQSITRQYSSVPRLKMVTAALVVSSASDYEIGAPSGAKSTCRCAIGHEDFPDQPVLHESNY